MAAYTNAPPSFIPSPPAHNRPLNPNFDIPAEIINQIYELVLEADDVGTVLPYPMPFVGAHHYANTSSTEHIIITSTRGLLRTCRVSRRIYYPMLKHRVLNLDSTGLRTLRVQVEDVNFKAFATGFIQPIYDMSQHDGGLAWNRFLQFPFEVRLRWTEAFLQRPKKGRLEAWLEFLNDDESVGEDHYGSFNYAFDMVSIVHADRLRDFFNSHILVREHVGPELTRLMSHVRHCWSTDKFIKEGHDVKYKGHWVGGQWVLEVLEDDADAEVVEHEQREDENAGEGFAGDTASRKRRQAVQKRKEKLQEKRRRKLKQKVKAAVKSSKRKKTLRKS